MRKKRRPFQEICLYYRQIVIMLVTCLGYNPQNEMFTIYKTKRY